MQNLDEVPYHRRRYKYPGLPREVWFRMTKEQRAQFRKDRSAYREELQQEKRDSLKREYGY